MNGRLIVLTAPVCAVANHKIDAKTKAMTVTLKDLAGTSLYTKTQAPEFL